MGIDFGTGDSRRLPPDEAFGVLGDATRLEILQALGRAGEALAFSELFDRVEYDTPGNFSYHLDKLQGHFVRRAEEGYELRQTGRRVVEAVLSGTVTDGPVVERTETDLPCVLCGGTMEVGYRREQVGVFCRDCGGTRGGRSPTADWADDAMADVVGHVTLPPAGVRDRSPAELFHAAEVWTVAEAQTAARGVCPRCAAAVDHAVKVCDDHDDADGRCDRCDQEFRVTVRVDCSNCIFGEESVFTKFLLADEHLMQFMIAHGVDPLAPETFHIAALEETTVSEDPFELRVRFAVDGDALTLTVDEELTVQEATQKRVAGVS